MKIPAQMMFFYMVDQRKSACDYICQFHFHDVRMKYKCFHFYVHYTTVTI